MYEIVVAAPSVVAAEVGARVGDDGGSVIDALIAATITAMCSEPGVCAPGGGGFLTVGIPGEEPISIDGYMAMPGRGRDPQVPVVQRSVSMEYGGGVTTEVGPGSIAVPGGFAAFDAAHRRWGQMSWSAVMAHVADALEGGFPLPTSCHYYLEFSGETVFGEDPASREALFDGNRLRSPGEKIVVPGLTEALRQIGAEGAETFYRGDLARAMVDDLTARGSRITIRDLAEYEVIVSPALQSHLGDWSIATTPPPAVGGVGLSRILRLVESSSRALDPAVWVAAQREVFGLRANRLEPADDRLAAGWELMDEIADSPPASGATVSIAAAGSDGAVAAATMSGGYGSGVIPRGTGLWMNNSLGETELNPGGLSATAIGERLISNMAPTVAIGPERRLGIGSPGADRITSALATTITLILHGTPLDEAVEHPRVHVEYREARIAAEPGLGDFPSGWPVRIYDRRDMFFGGVTAAEVGQGTVIGHADSRRTGGVASSVRPAMTDGPASEDAP